MPPIIPTPTPPPPIMSVAARSVSILPIVRAAVKATKWGPWGAFVKAFLLILLKILPVLIPLILMADHAASLGDLALTGQDPEAADYPGPLREAVMARRSGTLDES